MRDSRITPIALAVLLAITTLPVLAQDTGTPVLPGLVGGAIVPLGDTEVQLVRQTVLLDVVETDFTSSFGEARFGLGFAVSAEHTLLNPDDEPLALAMGMPLRLPSSDIFQGYLDIRNAAVFVDDVALPVTEATIDGALWLTWEATLQPGENPLRVVYEMPATVEAPRATMAYLLDPAAAWAGTVSSTQVTLRFRETIDPLFLLPNSVFPGDTSNNYVVDGNALMWAFEDLEPGPADGIALSFIMPSAWENVRRARTAVEAADTAQNQWQLAQAYAQLIDADSNILSEALALVALDAYRTARAAEPDNLALARDYAQFLRLHAGVLLPASLLEDNSLLLTAVVPTATAVPTLTMTPAPTPTLVEITVAPPTHTATPAATVAPTEQPGIFDPAINDVRSTMLSERGRWITAGSMMLLLFMYFVARRYRQGM